MTAVSVAAFYTCAIQAGRVYCWGANAPFTLRDGVPLQKSNGTKTLYLRSISCTYTHCCGLTKRGRVWCLGDNGAGACGQPVLGTIDSGNVQRVEGVRNVEQLCTGRSYTCAQVVGGSVWCWGQALFGVLGDRVGPSDFGNTATPSRLQNLPPLRELTCADTHVCGIRRNDSMVLCWGFSNNNQIPGILGVSFLPVSWGVRASEVALGGWHTCALTSPQTASCWGRNVYGEAPTDEIKIPRPVVRMQGGLVTTYFLTTDGNLYILGQDVMLPSYNAEKLFMINGDLNVSAYAASSTHVCVITTEKQLWCAGQSVYAKQGLLPKFVHI